MSLEWTESYNCHKANLGFGLSLNVNWDSLRSRESRETGYKVYACGVELKGLSSDLESGKMRAVVAAREILTKALAKLDEAVSPTGSKT